ncbi:MAG: tetratricopeptide repeat protein, partial [Planctomycetota bacterium]
HDARIGLLLAEAAKAMQQQGLAVRVRANIAEVEVSEDRRGIEELSRLIEADPDFVDAFLSIPAGEVDERVFAMLLSTLEVALERQPEHAELHFHCGRVLDRLGRRDAAIGANERAVEIDPTFTRALIELGKLYRDTDRTEDATTRFEQAIFAGAEYADVYYLLGNLYRDQGQVGRARNAYRRALAINNGYEAAQQALVALST